MGATLQVRFLTPGVRTRPLSWEKSYPLQGGSASGAGAGTEHSQSGHGPRTQLGF